MKAVFQIFVSDIRKGKKWYVEKLGAKVLANYPSYKCVLLSIGNEQIDMGQPIAKWGLNWKKAKRLVGRQMGILLEVMDVEKEYERLSRKGVKFLFKPKKAPWGEYIADFQDMDGNILRLV
jgi:catechol 2,3-dioxygenase-like lactoylglutathione lyase family enzyme